MAEATPKSADKAPANDLALSSDGSKDRTRPSRPDHGKSPQWVLDQEKAQKDAAKDPWGNTPMQSRTEPPVVEDVASPVDGLNPHLDNNTHIVGGTLPPV